MQKRIILLQFLNWLIKSEDPKKGISYFFTQFVPEFFQFKI